MVLIQGYNRTLCTERSQQTKPDPAPSAVRIARRLPPVETVGDPASTASRTHTRQIQGVVTLAAEAASATPSVDEKMIKQLVSHWLNSGGDALSRSVGIEPGHSATFLARLCV